MGSFIASLLEWQNLLFTTTVGLGALLFGLQAFGLIGDHDGDADHDFDHDAGDHADHDMSAGKSLVLMSGLKAIGIGRVPVSLLLPVGLVGFGFLGLFASLALGGFESGGKFGLPSFFLALGLAVGGSTVLLGAFSNIFHRFIPDTQKTVSEKRDLLGLIGTVKSKQIDLEFGQVRVKDSFGNELEVPCVTIDAERIPKYGEEVVLVQWEPETNRFRVAPFERQLKEGEGA